MESLVVITVADAAQSQSLGFTISPTPRSPVSLSSTPLALLMPPSSMQSASSSPDLLPCPHPSPMTSHHHLLPSPSLDLSSFSLPPPALPLRSVPFPSPASSAVPVPRPSSFPSSLSPSLSHPSSLWSLRFAPLSAGRPWFALLLRLLTTPSVLFFTSLVLLSFHIVVFYLAVYTLFTLFTGSHALPLLATVSFTVYLGFLLVRSTVTSALILLRLFRPTYWLPQHPSVPAVFYPTLLVFRSVTLLLLLYSTAVLIFSTSLSFSSPVLLLIFALLASDAVTLSIPIITVPLLAFAVPIHSLHLAFPYVPLREYSDSDKPVNTGMDLEDIARLGVSVWHSKADDDGTEVCAICIMPPQDGDLVRELPRCKHTFHKDCVDSWLVRRQTCPLCVQRVEVCAGR